MSQKRGRPLSGISDDLAINRRRLLTRERTRKYRLRQIEARIAMRQPSRVQVQQEETIITEPPIQEQDVISTPRAQGIRIPGDLNLNRDLDDALLQESAQDEDEYILDPERQGAVKHSDPIPLDFFKQFARRSESEASNGSRVSYIGALTTQDHPTSLPYTSSSRYVQPLSTSEPRARLAETQGLGDYTDEFEDLGDEFEEDSHEPQGFRGNVGEVGDELGRHRGEIGRHGNEMEEEEDEPQGPRADDEESHISFASAREPEEDAEDVGEIDPGEYTADKLFQQLQGGHHGCSEEAHDETHREHIASEGNNHYALDEIFRDRRFLSVIESDELLSTEELEERRMPNAAQWESMFCGVPRGGEPNFPRNVCLHKESTQGVEPQVVFDVDSFLGFWSSLAGAKNGLLYQPAPQMKQNIQTDVHIQTQAYPDNESSGSAQRMLRDVPHCLLGRVAGANHITIHVLFPHLSRPARDDRFVSMTDEQLARWTDRVFHPALWRAFPASYSQHLPPTYRVARANSKAHQVEGRKIQTSSYQAQQAIAYHLQPEYLDEVWATVLQTIETPGFQDFREPQLFFSAKGTKLSFKSPLSQSTLLDVIERFESFFDDVVDIDFVEQDRFYVDVGKEICPGVSHLPGQRRHVGDEAQVYLWRRCCLEEYMHWMYDGSPPSARGQGQRYYHQNMLYDASCLTSVTPKHSVFRRGGLIYSQFYGSVKETTDASKCMPFGNDALEEMALDPHLRRAARNVAGGHRREVEIVENAYRASKRRARVALLDSRRRSFGIREEHRITWELFQRLKAYSETEDRVSLTIAMTDCPRYAWPVQTKVYLDFLWRSVDKFAAGFEVVRAQSRTTMVSWEQTKMMCAFLRCLRFVLGGNQIEPESALWWSKRTGGEPPHDRTWYGLGFCNTLPRHRYCWFEPRIDWERLCFKPSITSRVLFGNNMLRGQVLRRGATVKTFFDKALALERGLEWVALNRGRREIRDQVLTWIVHICLQQFRIDVLRAVEAEIRVERQEEALKGERPFCYEYFSEIMIPRRDLPDRNRCYLISGNRCAYKTPEELLHFLINHGDGRPRECWEDKPFRKLYQRAKAGLASEPVGVQHWFIRRYEWMLFRYHWILPYPCPNGLLQTSKDTLERMWYSIMWDANSKLVWARKQWQPNQPGRLPAFVRWDEEEWREWILLRGGVLGESDGDDDA